ncbi:MAG: FtsX-like permease family protein, partial [Acidobacteriota bacterium]
NIRVMSEVINQALWAPRMGASLLAIFGLIALILAMVGIYGVLAYSVSQRTHEIGIRMALGAQQQDVVKMVLKHGLQLILIGVGIGLAIGIIFTRLITSLLYGISAIDPVTFLGTPVLLAIVALVASYIPARRAARVDPMIALRHD